MAIATKWFGFGRDSNYDLGLQAYDRGEFERAAELFTSCLDSTSDPATLRLARFYLVESHIRMGETALQAGNAALATAALACALDLEPSYADVHFRLALAWGAAGDEAKEREHVEAALALNPNFAEAVFCFGVLEIENERPEAGWAHIDRALAIEPVLDGIHLAAARKRFAAGDVERACQGLRRQIGVRRDNANAHAEAADSLVHERKFKEAAFEYEAAIRLAPHYPDVRCKYGQALLELDRIDEAEQQFCAALDINPKYVEAMAQLGIAQMRLGRAGEARETFKRVLALDPFHVIAAQEAARPA
jgi:Tfp pilus assembly protein PilF